MKVLLVEDEKRMVQALNKILILEKYEVDYFTNGLDGLLALGSEIYDIAIIDVMLPKMNGFEIVKRARKEGIKTPIIILTSKADLDDIVQGLDYGADDYLTKPFKTQELLARIRALVRRSIKALDNHLSFGDIVLDVNMVSLFCSTTNQSVRLSKKEYKLLEYLIANNSQILTREQLMIKIFGLEDEAEYNNVEVYMSFARKKLMFVGSKTVIKSIRGIGYQLRYENV